MSRPLRPRLPLSQLFTQACAKFYSSLPTSPPQLSAFGGYVIGEPVDASAWESRGDLAMDTPSFKLKRKQEINLYTFARYPPRQG